jgi:hypothetical protein
MPRRLDDLIRFYAILGCLERAVGGRRTLAACSGRMDWPRHGIYFFMEDGETRTDTGDGPRIVRVGTHALTSTSKTTLWNRLSQHRGQERSGGGNHRGSIFRLLIGSTLVAAGEVVCPTWGLKNNASRDIRKSEEGTEAAVSRIIRAMPFVWLAVEDPPGSSNFRGVIERNSIALLSNLEKPPLDPPSPNWRGRACDRGRGRVRDSGLWNQNHVDEDYDPVFLNVLEDLVLQIGGPS